MQAWEIVSGDGVDALKLVDRETPTPGPGQVRVRMNANS
ncbi:MAG TPA: NAD(P)-dependent alcohol dehydrogenase, partial [Rhodobacteraceae bacterium]|nr:NAD(P)-dependent alcohol dehydrogenase [Paracoccaceae bacterium]